MQLIKQYSHWLHGQWPSGRVEKLPVVNDDGSCNIPGVYIAGDLTGTPLLKFSAQSGAQAVREILADKSFLERKPVEGVDDVIIIGAGISGYAAAIAAKQAGLNFTLIEANQPLSTIENFPQGKAIYTYPKDMQPKSELIFSQENTDKESLLADLKEQIRAHDISHTVANVSHIAQQKNTLEVVTVDKEKLLTHRVIVAIGRSGNYRKLNITGEHLDKVSNRFIDASVYQYKDLLIVGGGDSALEAAIATSEQQANVTLSYRKEDFSRAKVENISQVNRLARQGKLSLKMATELKKIDEDQVTLQNAQGELETLNNDRVLLATGREAPLDFFRRSKINIHGESSLFSWVVFTFFLVALTALYDWKGYGFFSQVWNDFNFPNNVPQLFAGISPWFNELVNDRSSLLGTLVISLKSRSFYYTLAYTLLVGIFGWQRIKRRKTPYVTLQTSVLFSVQLLPLFLLPEIILPYLGYNGVFDAGTGKAIADALFPSYISAQDLANHVWPEWGHPRAYWHAYSFIFAWPLGVYTVFTDQPQYVWLSIAFVQTFIIIPFLVFKWGKGAYCSWICSCGGMAETMGDLQRHKMPHGKKWNYANMLGQFILAVAVILLIIRILGWVYPDTWMNHSFKLLLGGQNAENQLVNPLSWKWFVDIFLAGILGFGLYFKYSGRTWCRFACPLAALMNIYSRFSRFAILSEKSKCISCNQCTAICHQGIDVMAFANKGKPMIDPQCVRCSACVSTCPTGTLRFGEVDKITGVVRNVDKLAANALHTNESSTHRFINAVQAIEVKNV